MNAQPSAPIDALILALPETSGSALYGMYEVLGATGFLWQALTGTEPARSLIRPRIAALTLAPFRCMNGIPVEPNIAVVDDPEAPIIVLPDIWLEIDGDIRGRNPEIMDWLRRSYRRGSTIYAACTGSILLAESGLLDGHDATSHWAFAELFRTQYPEVNFRPEPNLSFADRAGRIVTAGGITSWHDLAIHIISRHASPGEALRVAKAYLLKWHSEGQLPYTNLVRHTQHADSAVRACEGALSQHFRAPDALQRAVRASKLPERTLKRRFKTATGVTLIEHVQRLRIEEAKRLLETTDEAVDEISAASGYEEPAFFRRLFKRHTGLTPFEYRRMFAPIARAHTPA